MNQLVRPQDLALPEARVAPEFRDLVEARKDARGDALPLRIPRAQQQNPSRRLQMPHQRPHPLRLVGRHQPLLGKHVLQLFVVLVGKLQVVRLFDRHS